MNQPYFSVVIPLYNKETQINRTIDSVLSQTCHDFEVVVVNDGRKNSQSKYKEKTPSQNIKKKLPARIE